MTEIKLLGHLNNDTPKVDSFLSTVTRLSPLTVLSREPGNKVVSFPDPRCSTHIRAHTILGPGNETRKSLGSTLTLHVVIHLVSVMSIDTVTIYTHLSF